MRPDWTNHTHLHNVQTVRVGPYEDRAAVRERQTGRERGGLLRKPLHARGLRARASRTNRRLKVVRDCEPVAVVRALRYQLERFCGETIVVVKFNEVQLLVDKDSP